MRLVATDLDETLLRTDGTVSPYTRRVLAAVEDAGVHVVFVTARPPRWMDDLWPLVGGHGLAIVSNGAAVYDVRSRSVVESTLIPVDDGLALVERVRAALPTSAFAVETLAGIRHDETYVEMHPTPPGTPVGPLAEVWDAPALKLLVQAPDVDPAVLQATAATAVGESAVATSSSPALVEISAPGVTKAAALARVCAGLGIDAADVVAFGDGPNDLAMLAWAGTSYAVANAHPDVLAAADHVAPDHDDDGVARTVARLAGLPADLL